MFISASANAPSTYRYVKQTVTWLAAITTPQLKQHARFQTSAMVYLRPLLFCDIMQQFLDYLTLQDGTTACPETLVNNHQYTLCNIPQEWGLEANYMHYYTVLNPAAAQSTINQMSLWFVPPTCFSLHVAILL
jgi:hypothetical protein